MRLVHRERLEAFASKFKDSSAALSAWARAIESGRPRHLVELKQALGSADYVRPYVVFNIAGNKYRLVALVNFELGVVSVERVMTHAEYDRGRWRE